MNDVVFQYPYFLAAPLLFLLLYLLRKKKNFDAALFPSYEIISSLPKSFKVLLRKPLLFILATIFIIALSIGASRPEKILSSIAGSKARSIMLAVDLSLSMSAKDFSFGGRTTSRIEGVKKVLLQFIEERKEDRLGLVVFGSSAFLQCPLTLDYSVLLELVSRLQVGMAGDATAIGDGLGLSIKRVQNIPAISRAIVLLTDGSNNAGQVNPIKAAKVAKDLGIKIHTIGIGSNNPITLNQPGPFFMQQGIQQVEFDEKTLKEIADTTGGVYFNASSVEELSKVYEEIDKLEQSDVKNSPHREVTDYAWVFAFLGLLFLFLYLISDRYVFAKIP